MEEYLFSNTIKKKKNKFKNLNKDSISFICHNCDNRAYIPSVLCRICLTIEKNNKKTNCDECHIQTNELNRFVIPEKYLYEKNNALPNYSKIILENLRGRVRAYYIKRHICICSTCSKALNDHYPNHQKDIYNGPNNISILKKKYPQLNPNLILRAMKAYKLNSKAFIEEVQEIKQLGVDLDLFKFNLFI